MPWRCFSVLALLIASGCHPIREAKPNKPEIGVEYCQLAEAIMATKICPRPGCSGTTLADDECVAGLSTESRGMPVRLFEYSLNSTGDYGDPLLAPGAVCSKMLFVPLIPVDGADAHMMIVVKRESAERLMYQVSPIMNYYESGKLAGGGGTACGVGSRGIAERIGGEWRTRPVPIDPFW